MLLLFYMDNAIFRLENPISKQEAAKMPPMTLAFVGDAAQSLYSRTRAAVGSDSKTGELHKEVTKVVNAVAQAAEVCKFLPLFTEEETDIFKRARNCKLQTTARRAEISEYRKASGFEAVIGFLYLTGDVDRMLQFLSAAYEDCVIK